jgi:ferredoxin
MKVTIERDECTMCGVCWESCPEFFEESPEDGLSQVVEKYRKDDALGEGVAPNSLSDCISEAAEGCPVEIIEVEED